jgi:hypothetical protein
MWSDPNFINLVYIYTALLVPIIPAFIFFYFLPSEANVSGPLRGLRIKLTGAFGGYFVLAILILYAPRPKAEQGEVWTVKGGFTDDTPLAKQGEILVTIVEPPLIEIPGDNTFKVLVPVTQNNGKPRFPTLIVDRQPTGKFAPAVIHLEQMPNFGQHFKLTYDKPEHEIKIEDHIQLKENSVTYNSKGSQ